MNNTLCIRNLILGDGKPKTCVSLVDTSTDTLLYSATLARALAADIVEWRLDCLPPMEDIILLRTVKQLKVALKGTPLLLTFRTVPEGGKREIKQSTYGSLLRLMIASESIDLIDIELSCKNDLLSLLIEEAKNKEIAVVLSSHDLYGTPSKEAMLNRLQRMRQLGADIPKLAVMPHRFADVLSLLAVSEEFYRQADCPFITMSMGELGQLSRISGHFTGSAVTFGYAENCSAPGQLPMRDLQQILAVFEDTSALTS